MSGVDGGGKSLDASLGVPVKRRRASDPIKE